MRRGGLLIPITLDQKERTRLADLCEADGRRDVDRQWRVRRPRVSFSALQCVVARGLLGATTPICSHGTPNEAMPRAPRAPAPHLFIAVSQRNRAERRRDRRFPPGRRYGGELRRGRRAGNDTLRGTPGNDALFGGPGTDRFELRGGNDVTDVEPGEVVVP